MFGLPCQILYILRFKIGLVLPLKRVKCSLQPYIHLTHCAYVYLNYRFAIIIIVSFPHIDLLSALKQISRTDQRRLCHVRPFNNGAVALVVYCHTCFFLRQKGGVVQAVPCSRPGMTQLAQHRTWQRSGSAGARTNGKRKSELKLASPIGGIFSEVARHDTVTND